MKSKSWSILFVFIFVLIVSSTGLYAQEIRGEGYEVLTTIATPRYTPNHLRKIFRDRCKNLSDLFKEGSTESLNKIVEYYGSSGWILTHENELVMGDALRTYLAGLMGNANANLLRDGFECLEVVIGFDRILAVGPSSDPLTDPIYPLRESITIHIDIDGESEHHLDSVAYSLHQRRTF